MSVRSSIRWWYRGPGIALVITGAIIGVGAIVRQGQDKADRRRAAHEKTRELGHVSPAENVDQSTAAKEAVLSSRKLSPGFTTTPETSIAPIPNAPGGPGHQAQLPALVSFYTQVAPTPSPTPAPQERPKPVEIWLPRGTLIPCVLVNTVESSHINTPVVGEVTRDVYQGGHLIIPAGAIATCFAQAGAVRDRIEVAGKWSLTYPDGKEFELTGIALDRESDPTQQQFGIEDGSAGLQGETIESDKYGNAKAFIALLLTSATQAGTAAVSGAISHGTGAGVGIGLPDTTPILSKYLDQLLNGTEGDARFVRVRASTEFYLFPVDVIEPTKRSVGARRQESEAPLPQETPVPQTPLEMERELLRTAQPGATPEPSPRIHY